jgi:hypothetical protein
MTTEVRSYLYGIYVDTTWMMCVKKDEKAQRPKGVPPFILSNALEKCLFTLLLINKENLPLVKLISHET